MFSITFWVSPQCDTHLHVKKEQTKRKKGIFFYVLVKQNKKKEVQSHVFEVVTFRSRLVC